MPIGYQNRLSNAYWSVDNLTWDGAIWSSALPVNDFTMTPIGSMDMTFKELRMLLKVIGNLGVGTRLVTVFDGLVVHGVYVTPERANQFVTLRIVGEFSMIKVAFDPGSIIEVREIEAGYVGFH